MALELNKKCVEKDVPFVLFIEGMEVYHLTYQEHIHRYVFASKFAGDKVVLDAGCGVGYGSSYLAKKGAKQVIGADILEEAILQAAMHYKGERADFVRLDGLKLPFSDHSFEVVVSFEVIEHLKDYEGFLSECKRVLKESGTFICSTPNKDVTFFISRTPWHIKEFGLGEIRDLVSRYFDIEGMYGQYLLGRWAKNTYLFRFLIGRALRFFGLGMIADFLSYRVLRESPPIIFRQEDIDKMLKPVAEVLSLRAGLTPQTTVIVAKAGKFQ